MEIILETHECKKSCSKLLAIFERPVESRVPPWQLREYISEAFKVEPPSVATPEPENVPDTPDNGTTDNAASIPEPFPPKVLSTEQQLRFIREWAQAVTMDEIAEAACGCCGQLSQIKSCKYEELTHPMFQLLASNDELGGGRLPGTPVICSAAVSTRNGIKVVRLCTQCWANLKRRTVPTKALANGLWLGDVPPQLKKLNFVEKLVIALYRHNVSVARVAKGQRKMITNAIVFPQPVAQLNKVLPITKTELDECLVVVFTGPNPPTAQDYLRTAFLVRPNVIHDALLWLKANHLDYKDVIISTENLRQYEANPAVPPVGVKVISTNGQGNVEMQNVPSYASDTEIGTETGPCPLAVAGLVGENLTEMSKEQKVALALKHMDEGNPFVIYGRSSDPESIYSNPQLYPGMFPWLFPYGMGGFANARMRPKLKQGPHVKALLMYHDYRFQTDEYFPFLVFNQMQIKASVRGGYLLANRKNFNETMNKILSIDRHALDGLIQRAKDQGFVHAEMEAERSILQILASLDHIGGHVPGSNTQRRYQRNEIRSLMYERGAPSFFITFAPVDFKSPICMYFAGQRIDLSALCPNAENDSKRLAIIANNPVACARFFNLMVNLFIKIILKADSNEIGLFGKTSSYYGTVESQGRMTLHLHLLLWIKDSYSPLTIRNKVKENNAEFKSALIDWLESAHQGDFCFGKMADVAGRLDEKNNALPAHTGFSETSEGCAACKNGDPTLSIPHKVPDFTNDIDAKRFLDQVKALTDEVVYCSNRHDRSHLTCRRPDGSCKARFPRPTPDNSEFDSETGTLCLRKSEAWINTFSIVLSYVLRCNSDVTSLLSGTQITAVIAYVTDYITKSSLKTHTLFEIIRAVLDRNQDIEAESETREDAARRLLTKVVNATIARQEIGAPMVCAYLLGHPDHYTDANFKPFYWFSHVSPVATAWDFELSQDKDQCDKEKVVIKNTPRGLQPWSKVHDYLLRPPAFEHYSVYEYLATTVVKKLNAKSRLNLVRCSGKKSKLAESLFPSNDLEPASPNDEEHPEDEDEDISEETDEIVESSSTCYQFEAGHPNRATHAVFKVKQSKRFVLNFVGGSLPRPDHGDKERYSLIMLALFKPEGWRDPRSIKSPDESWEKAFLATSFSDSAQRLMANMNLLHECYDASHDYAAQRRKAQAEAGDGNIMSEDIESFSIAYEDQLPVDFHELLEEALAGNRNKRHKSTMEMLTATKDEIHPMFHNSADNDVQTQHGIDSSVIEAVQNTVVPKNGWKSVLKDANKERLINIRMQTSPSEQEFQSTGAGLPSSHSNGVVRVATLDEVGNQAIARINPVCPELPPCAIVEHITQDFCLNKEQNRAFRVITSHLRRDSRRLSSNSLKMYLGGIGGTGKSTVIKAVITFLEARNEGHRYVVLAPTGSAACLLQGSTYHSALGLNPKSDRVNPKSLEELRGRFGAIDIIFIDEVSMLSCQDLYRITRQLSSAFDQPMASFGGKHVVLAGDFGQLPPAGRRATPLYNNSVPLSTLAQTEDGLMRAMGKATWHLFTTVVILRENMRQRGMSENDIKFRTCLENMRYARCTTEDIALLNTRVAKEGGPSLHEQQFRHIPVITPRNAQRDALNSLGVVRFAAESGQALSRFYCLDSSGKNSTNPSVAKARKEDQRNLRGTKRSALFSVEGQQALWDLPPTLTDHVPGVLDLCIGMPVMLKTNEATELCATNGAEANVVGWSSEPNPHGVESLKTLYVKLKNPPSDMKLTSLPTNVVPLTPTSQTVTCSLPTRTASVTRTQVNVLPNFAMTDFGAQGRTRPHNPVDLRYCRNHQSMYTCLSRSSSLDGTLILFAFNPNKITCGASGDLRREYRELEILDDITRMRSDVVSVDSMPAADSPRNAFLQWYRKKFGDLYLPPTAHSALKRKEKVDDHVNYDKPYVPMKDMIEALRPMAQGRGQKRKEPPTGEESDSKRCKGSTEGGDPSPADVDNHLIPSMSSSSRPVGLLWDSNDWSCAYDVILGCLWNMYEQYPRQWNTNLIEYHWIIS
ncbi:hypothetical protein NLI96_g4222 [Meripilus lineatus]|uniref:ATP-dependent DNA helicase n=1 Tax=Meripilus lineatus TaxID=2056292 RepID=A0AAD5V5A8_9APHY|nr:hypothetical protein NLI96_g4222 [Physisporinus lineatus]